MALYKFKEIQTVPPAKDFVDIVLSRTQRKTPTVVHPQFKITRIRNFYLRKVKYAQTTFNEKMSKILEDFPKIDDIHPFYADLCNVLYDRDHYKLALGQVNAVRGIIDNIGKDYCKLMKFSDTPYKCKMLKRAALGRMCTAVKKMQSTLTYLEEVRQHLARLPAINPATRTLLITGYPNVGKSSFMNIVTNANVDVQPYAFTTKSLFVGHFDFEYTRWQVIDTPGILDHPLEDRNTIEMTAITALAHIQSTVLFFIDISENCGWTIPQQVDLFRNIKPLFKGKPLLIVLNKTDLRTYESLTPEELQLIESCKEGAEVAEIMHTSCAMKTGVDEVKNKGCELLFSKRIENKIRQNKVDQISNRIFLTKVQPRADRPAFIPPSVAAKRGDAAAMEDAEMGAEEDESAQPVRVLEKWLQERNGGAGVYSVDLRKHFQLANEEWKYDVVPEIMDGHNVADFIDPDIEAKLEALEKEEELLFQASIPTAEEVAEEERYQKAAKVLDQVHAKKRFKRLESVLKRNSSALPQSRLVRHDAADVVERLAERGTSVPVIEAVLKARTKSADRGRSLTRKRKRDETTQDGVMERSMSRSKSVRALSASLRGKSMQPSKVERSLSRPADAERAAQIRLRKTKELQKHACKGEADRHIPDLKPKHLFSGKLGRGKRDRR